MINQPPLSAHQAIGEPNSEGVQSGGVDDATLPVWIERLRRTMWLDAGLLRDAAGLGRARDVLQELAGTRPEVFGAPRWKRGASTLPAKSSCAPRSLERRAGAPISVKTSRRNSLCRSTLSCVTPRRSHFSPSRSPRLLHRQAKHPSDRRAWKVEADKLPELSGFSFLWICAITSKRCGGL